MKKVFVDGINNLSIKEVAIPTIGPEEILVKLQTACICSQTDLHIVEGLHPSATPFPSPIGHEGAGDVVEAGERVENYMPGDRVAVKGLQSGCLAEYAKVQLEDILKIPDSVSYEQGALLEIASCVLSLVTQCVKLGDRVLIIGQGAAGLIATQLVKAAGSRRIVVSEPSEFKRNLAGKFGADIGIDPSKRDIFDCMQEETEGEGFDVVLEFVGMPKTISSTPGLIKKQGTIGIFGACCEPVSFDFLELHYRYGKIIMTGHEFGYSHAPFAKVLNLVVSKQLKLESLITHRFKIDQIEDAFGLIKSKNDSAIRLAIQP